MGWPWRGHGDILCAIPCVPAVCSIRVIGESDIMQEFLSESDEVGDVIPRNSMEKIPSMEWPRWENSSCPTVPKATLIPVPRCHIHGIWGQFQPFFMGLRHLKLPEFLQTPQYFGIQGMSRNSRG